MDIYIGTIKITSVHNFTTDEVNPKAALDIHDVRFVHYPSCQQLTIWLPQNGDHYNTLKVWNKTKNSVEEECPISKWQNGAIQLLKDTLYLSPGKYTIEINTSKGIQHEVSFTKFHHTDVRVNTGPVLNNIESNTTDLPIVYKNGFGTIIPNEDLALADDLKKKIPENLQRRIEYEGNARAGTITYIENDVQIKFSHEMGGGDCLFFIFIPTENEWEVKTKVPQNKRSEIIQFIAETVRRDQASSSRVAISDNEITFYGR